MKVLLIIIISFYGCTTKTNKSENEKNNIEVSDSQKISDTTRHIDTFSSDNNVYSNQTFKNVVVNKTGNGFFEINGEARVFEATFYYYLRQNNKESDEEFVTASMGAPEWGKFNFSVNSNIYRNDIPFYLVIFEASAKDGRRINELTIRLF